MQTLQAEDALPTAIKRRAEAISKLAGVSSKTLYRSENRKLWHPEQHLDPGTPASPAQSGKPPESISLLAPPSGIKPKPIKRLKRRNTEKVYTLERSMKCRLKFAVGSVVRKKEEIKIRGVWGDCESFPQGMSRDSNESVIFLNDYRSLPPLPPSATPEEQERHRNQEAFRHCIFRLKWTKRERDEYVESHFEGRRFYQLSLEEQTLLIYQLRDLTVDIPR